MFTFVIICSDQFVFFSLQWVIFENNAFFYFEFDRRFSHNNVVSTFRCILGLE